MTSRGAQKKNPQQAQASSHSGRKKRWRQVSPPDSESDQEPAMRTVDPSRWQVQCKEVKNNPETSDVKEVEGHNDKSNNNMSTCLMCEETSSQTCKDDAVTRAAAMPVERMIKGDTSKDLLTIFTDQVDMKFTNKDSLFEQLHGHWCMLCK
jgi:hypothetical protein